MFLSLQRYTPQRSYQNRCCHWCELPATKHPKRSADLPLRCGFFSSRPLANAAMLRIPKLAAALTFISSCLLGVPPLSNQSCIASLTHGTGGLMKRVGPKITRGQSKYIHSDLFFILVKHRMHATPRLPHVVRAQISRNLAATFAKDMRILWPPCPPPPLPLLPHGSQVFPQLFLICYHLRAVLLLAAAKSEGAACRAQKEGCTLSVRVSALSGFSNLNGILRETKTLLFWGVYVSTVQSRRMVHCGSWRLKSRRVRRSYLG